MHAFFAPFGIYPNNAIVGGSGSIAPGAALFKRVNRKPGIVVANIGDASFGCGPVWEGITFSAMDQYRTLWDRVARRRPADHLQLHEQFLRHGRPAVRRDDGDAVASRGIGAGVNPEQMHAERVNGYDPLPVIDAFRRKKQVLLEGRGPVLLDTVTYRISGHSPSDASSYRSKEEIERWQQADSIRAFRAKLLAHRARCRTTALDAAPSVRSKRRSSTCSSSPPTSEASPRVAVDSELVGAVMFSNRRVEKFDDRAARVPADRWPTTRACSRFAARSARPRDDGKPVPKMKAYNVRDAHLRGDAAPLLDRSRR